MHMKLWDSDGFCRSACTRLESVFHNLAQNALSGKIFGGSAWSMHLMSTL